MTSAQSTEQVNSERRVIWLTGASSGIGRCLALDLASEGHHVIVSARSTSELRVLETLSANITALPCDITDVGGLSDLQSRLSAVSAHLDQIILCAGNCEYLNFPEPDWEAVFRVMEVNYFGAVNCVKLALPMLLASTVKRPHIVSVASMVTKAHFPKAEAYGASKAAVQYFFNSLRLDLVASNIDVTVVNPGFVDTPLTQKNDFPMPFLTTAEKASKRTIRALKSRPKNVSLSKRLSFLLAMAKLMPALWQKIVLADNKNKSSDQVRSKDSSQ
ncbi:MAG: short-subunit dehydrogenase [Gammaproteobacteria bacterium]|jgi:short-subunit dehydrogenase